MTGRPNLRWFLVLAASLSVLHCGHIGVDLESRGAHASGGASGKGSASGMGSATASGAAPFGSGGGVSGVVGGNAAGGSASGGNVATGGTGGVMFAEFLGGHEGGAFPGSDWSGWAGDFSMGGASASCSPTCMGSPCDAACDCTSEMCRFVCPDGGSCRVDASNASHVELRSPSGGESFGRAGTTTSVTFDCREGKLCEADCGTTDACRMNCYDNASCVLYCQHADCVVNCESGTRCRLVGPGRLSCPVGVPGKSCSNGAACDAPCP